MQSNCNLILICSKILFPQLIREQEVKERSQGWHSGGSDLILSVKGGFYSDDRVLGSLPAPKSL